MNIEEIVYHYFLYNGSVVDIVINYLLIILYTVTNLIPWTTCSSRRNIFINLHSLVVMTIQVLCWIFLEAYGVSLIWCGQLGLLLTWLLCLLMLRPRTILISYQLVMKTWLTLPGLGAIVYYAISFPLITTVAHVLAVIVGALMAAPLFHKSLHEDVQMNKSN